MPYVKFSRDKRGYENFYLVQPSHHGKGRGRVLYWFRSPPNVKVGRPPFDPAIRRALEAQYPDVSFDWDAIEHTPIPPPVEPERWRERRRLERAQRAAEMEEAASGAEEADAAAGSEGQASVAAPGEAEAQDSAVAQGAAGEPTPETVDALPTSNVSSVAPEGQGAGAPASGRRRRRRRGRRRSQNRPQPQTSTSAPAADVRDPGPESE